MSIIKVLTVAALKALLNPSEDVLYFCVETACLYVYDADAIGTNDDELIVDPTTATGRFLATKAGAFAP